MKKAGIILQARMGSMRLPGKILKDLSGKPLLIRCIERLQQIDKSISIILATSKLKKDDPVAIIAKELAVPLFRGSEEDVLDRYYKAAKKYNLDVIVRATGDNPFVDYIEGKRLLDLFLNGHFDYINNIGSIYGFSLPIGSGLEIFSFAALEKSWKSGKAPYHREHVNEYILENSTKFNYSQLACFPENSCPELRLTVDTVDDFQFAEHVINKIGIDPKLIKTKDIINWWKTDK